MVSPCTPSFSQGSNPEAGASGKTEKATSEAGSQFGADAVTTLAPRLSFPERLVWVDRRRSLRRDKARHGCYN